MPEYDGVIGIYVAVGVRDGDGIMLGVNAGKGDLISLVAIDELVHEDKINRDRQVKILMKRRYITFII